MLKDITLGQFFPGDTIVHRLDPRTKLICVILFIVALFLAVNWTGYIIVIAATVLFMILSRISPKRIFSGLKPMIFIIVLTGALNMFYTKGTPVAEGWMITWEGIERAVQMILRITLLISGTFLLTYTTSPIAITDGLEMLLKPLKLIRFPVHEMTLMMSMALRFIPTLIEETRYGLSNLIRANSLPLMYRSSCPSNRQMTGLSIRSTNSSNRYDTTCPSTRRSCSGQTAFMPPSPPP